ncbi:MAG: hypothetical protein QNJ67_11570 [Kiloniellales bacterium]|nr:hypothetical protein [Kiloniellales bacterium]
MRLRGFTGFGTAIALMAFWAAGAWAQDIVKPPVDVEAKRFVSSVEMRGPNHQVKETASNDGFINTYTLTTEWGDATAVSNYRLSVRIREVNALKTLDEMSKAGVFGDALLNGALAPVKAVGDLVTAPVDTVSGAVKGFGSWIGNIASSAVSEDPNQEGALSAAAGWAQTKRSYAVQLGVDPYTDWPPLQEALVSTGRAAFAGGITAQAAVSVATKDTVAEYPVLGLGLTDTMNKKLVDNPPERLADEHRADLAALGIPKDTTEAFLKNFNYSPKEKLQLVEAVKRMEGAEGLEGVIAIASEAPDKRVARYLQQQADMMAKLWEQSRFSVVRTEKTAMLKMDDGRLLGVFPLDYVQWTQDLADYMPGFEAELEKAGAADGKELWFEGVVSPDGKKGLEGYGWTIKEKVQLLFASS